MPRISKKQEAINKAENRNKNLRMIFETVGLVNKVRRLTWFSANAEFVFDVKDAWGIPGDVGVKFSYSRMIKDERGRYNQDATEHVIVVPDSEDYHLLEVIKGLELMIVAHEHKVAAEAARKAAIASLTPEQKAALDL